MADDKDLYAAQSVPTIDLHSAGGKKKAGRKGRDGAREEGKGTGISGKPPFKALALGAAVIAMIGAGYALTARNGAHLPPSAQTALSGMADAGGQGAPASTPDGAAPETVDVPGEDVTFAALAGGDPSLSVTVEGLIPGDKLPLSASCFRHNVSPAINWGILPGAKSAADETVMISDAGEGDSAGGADSPAAAALPAILPATSSGAVASYAVVFERLPGGAEAGTSGDGQESPPSVFWAAFNIPAGMRALPAGAGSRSGRDRAAGQSAAAGADATGPGAETGTATGTTGAGEVSDAGNALLPPSVREGLNDNGRAGYDGPCDPVGRVEYRFRVFALDAVLDLPAGATQADMAGRMRGHVVGWGEKAVTHFFRL